MKSRFSPKMLLVFSVVSLCAGKPPQVDAATAGFPAQRPQRGSFERPLAGETLDISPPGFCWWRAGKRGQVNYRLHIADATGKTVYASPVLTDPVHVPGVVLAPGHYTWTVEALDKKEKVIDTRAPAKFSIAPNSFAQPWVAPETLLGRVPQEHPRLLFPGERLAEARATLTTTRRDAFESLRKDAKKALKLSVPAEPDYDEIKDPAVRKMAYNKAYGRLRKYHQGGMDPLALMYLLTGEKKYGLKAKEILLGAVEWDPEGISSVLAPYGDEVGLSLVRSEAHTYDWIYDLLSPTERDKVRQMLTARADQMLRRLEKRDFLASPEESHNGRLPGYMLEHAIVLAEEPRAAVWMDYAMRAAMTCFPHWAGKDGGWAEGISYGLAYNTIYQVPYESLRHATGVDLWQRPFYRKVRNFFMYAISPLGDIAPFGDIENTPARGRGGSIRSLLSFHANRYKDSTVRWWIDQFKSKDGSVAKATGTPALILPDTVEPVCPESLANDAAFFGVGWALLHSDITHPAKDLMVSFKCSPYGCVSHSHADQNSFAIMKGGASLAIPAGERYPTHGSPFHTKYVQQTMAHNAVLVNGEGQIRRDGSRGGELADFKTTPHMGYALGDAANCFGAPVKKNRRHVLLIRPSLVLVVDDLAADGPAEFQWLLHGHNRFSLDEPAQTIVSRKGTEAMTVTLITDGGFSLSQTDEWPVDPKEGYPKTTKELPEKQWHMTAATRKGASARRIAAVMAVWDEGAAPDYDLVQPDRHTVEVRARFGGDKVVARINLNAADGDPILESRYTSATGEEETLEAR
ncbi:MAG: DUF4962 domain-containing protein [Kiritimatiellales bacterium]|nr:DUF4962 domain-containing protein [Kiritimatiellales bacterium]